MDPNILGKIVFLYVNATYPGGSAAFTNEGGLISLCHSGKESNALLYHPNLPKSFENAIKVFNDKSPVKITIIHNYNFMDCDDIKDVSARISPVIESIIDDYNITMVANTHDPLILSILIPNKINEEIIPDIINRINDIPGLLRCYMIINGKTYLKLCDSDNDTPRVKIESDRCNITEDRITDLKITLAEDMDVLDFISKM
jgi:hypothetical protein